jgi:uncharacterized membrane protein YhaH (DUF805 family)
MFGSYASAWKRSFDYSGRSTRSEFWFFVLLDAILLVLLNGASLFLVFSFPEGFLADAVSRLAVVYGIAAYLARIPLAVRRMRDIGKSWAWVLTIPTCVLIPWFVYLAVQPSVLG